MESLFDQGQDLVFQEVLKFSGHTREAVANDLLSEGAAGFLQKPFTRSDLQTAIEAALSPQETWARA